MCPHRPPCPPADRPDRGAAHTVAFHPEQGWSLLCKGVIVFDDTGEILPDGRVIPPHHPTTNYLPPRENAGEGANAYSAGARPGLVKEVATASAVKPGAAVFASIDRYDRLTCPMKIVLLGDGLDASRRDEERTIADAALAAA
jgi:Family of unknown function (DUF5999)